MSEPRSTAWRRANRDRQKPQQAAAARRQYDKYRALLRAARDKPCEECSGSFPVVAMDLHHRDPADKLFPVAKILAVRMYDYPGKTREQVLAEEIAKCAVLCANCHRILHHAEPEALASQSPGTPGQAW